MDPDSVERLSPRARVEVQDRIARLFLMAKEFEDSGQPERRRPMRRKSRRRGWGKVWPVNDYEYRTTRDVILALWTPTGTATRAGDL